MSPSQNVTVWYSSIDSYGKRTKRKFRTIFGARDYAKRMVGDHPEIGRHYAVSSDGIGKIEVDGISITDLFGVENG
jgi:hypothetical protein